MAADEQTPEQGARNQMRDFYRILNNVIGELRSNEMRDTYASITLDEVLQQQLEFLTEGSPTRVSRRQRLQQVYDEFTASLQAMKDTLPSAFRQPDSRNDVNTAP